MAGQEKLELRLVGELFRDNKLFFLTLGVRPSQVDFTLGRVVYTSTRYDLWLTDGRKVSVSSKGVNVCSSVDVAPPDAKYPSGTDILAKFFNKNTE